MTKLSQLLSEWPPRTVAVQPWLDKREIYRQLTQKYVKGGWIQKIGNGAYIRSGDTFTWQGGVYALQYGLGLDVHVGGLTALELRGSAHFLPRGTRSMLYINGQGNKLPRYLPKWFVHQENLTIIYDPAKLFSTELGVYNFNCIGFWIKVSGSERALFEILALVPDQISFEHACLLMQHQNSLRIDIVQQLLHECSSKVIKRLFLHLARKYDLDWVHRININSIDLGKHIKRIGNGKIFDSELKLYVPEVSPDIENNIEVPDV